MCRSSWCCSRYRFSALRFIASVAPGTMPIFGFCAPTRSKIRLAYSLEIAAPNSRGSTMHRPALPIRQVIVADHTRQPVLIALLLPQHEEFADTVGLVPAHGCFSHVAECVFANFDCSVVLQRKHLQSGYHQFTPHLVANIVFDRLDEVGLAEAEAGLVVIKLQVIVDHVGEGRQITGVVSLKNPLIESFHLAVDGAVWIKAIGDALAAAAAGQGNQH